MIEQEVRQKIDYILAQRGWNVKAGDRNRNVFVENSVTCKLPSEAVKRLGKKRPDYTLFHESKPLAIIEAKKDSVVNLQDAMDQARDYAKRIGNVPILIACNGRTVKTEHIETKLPLRIDGEEVLDFLPEKILKKFKKVGTNEIVTIPEEVVRNRTDMIRIFGEMNDQLRNAGIHAGSDRFTEFSNILFLKLLSERNTEGRELWEEMHSLSDKYLAEFINSQAIPRLKKKYGGEVISETKIENLETLRFIIDKLNGIRLTSLDEDIKGMAFEHFIQRTTNSQNDLGEYFTPRHIVKFMVNLLNPKFRENLYDPFCGTGGFLTESFKHISLNCRHTKDNADFLQSHTVFGTEITSTARIAKMNMILFGDGHSGVHRDNSINLENSKEKYANVITNIPFSQTFNVDGMEIAGFCPKNPDEACILKSFESLKIGGKMAIVVPEGILFNKQHVDICKFLFASSKVRMIVRLPRGVFRPYTDAKASIIYLTDKGREKTKWFYLVNARNDGFDKRRRPILGGYNDLDKALFSYTEELFESEDIPEISGESNIGIVDVKDFVEGKEDLKLYFEWKKNQNLNYIKLEEIAHIKNGISITEDNAIDGEIPVIAGGRGSIAYYHNEYNQIGNCLTISKSGQYSGYVWWHDHPIWASDCIVIRSRDESKFLSQYLYTCLVTKQDEIYNRQQGVGQPHVYKQHIIDFPIPNISISKQKQLLEDFEKLNSTKIEVEREMSQKFDEVKNRIARTFENGKLI